MLFLALRGIGYYQTSTDYKTLTLYLYRRCPSPSNNKSGIRLLIDGFN